MNKDNKKIEFNNFNGWSNKDTWAVMLWLNNDFNNYTRFQRVINNTNNLQDLTDLMLYMELKDLNFGSDKIDFNNVNLTEIRQALTEEEF